MTDAQAQLYRRAFESLADAIDGRAMHFGELVVLVQEWRGTLKASPDSAA